MLFGALALIAVEKEWCDPELETGNPSKLSNYETQGGLRCEVD